MAKGIKLNNDGNLEETSDMAKVLSLGETGFVEIDAGGGSSGWQPHPDWIDISQVNDNEINLLVSDGGVGVAFAVTVASSGTYSIDWGDGVVEHNRTSGSTQSHQYTIGSGQAVSDANYTVFKIRIYNASNTITRWRVMPVPGYTRTQYSPILWAVFGTQGITDYSYAFYYNSTPIVYCRSLQSCTIPTFASCTNTNYMFQYCTTFASVVLPTSWGSVTNVGSMFNSCYALANVVLPTSWGSVIYVNNMFSNCYALTSVVLPSSWGNVTSATNMFSNCYALTSVVLPTSWGSVTNVYGMFQSCFSLTSIVLPTSWGSVTSVESMLYGCYALSSVVLPSSWGSVTSAIGMFQNCYALRNIINIEYLGSITTDANFTEFMRDVQAFGGIVTIASRLTKIGIYGASGYNLKVTGVRLTNANSTFTGSSPQADVSYCSMDATALNTLFGDLPTLAGKTIKVTGNPGAATCDTSIATVKGWTVTT